MIHVHIVEESALGRAGLEDLLRGPGIEILSSVASVAELEDRFAADLPAGIVVAAGDPAQLAATEEQLAASDLFHGLPVVLFMKVDEPSFDASAAIRMGARAVLSAEFSRGQVLAALEAVSQGFVVTTPLANPVQSAAPPQVELPALLEPLTARKAEDLRPHREVSRCRHFGETRRQQPHGSCGHRYPHGTRPPVNAFLAPPSKGRPVQPQPGGFIFLLSREMLNYWRAMPTLENTTQEVLTLAEKHFNLAPGSLSPDDDFFKKLGIDSLQTLELLSRLESHFQIELPDYEVQGVSDFKTLAERIQSRL